jgi:hypothetical protein
MHVPSVSGLLDVVLSGVGSGLIGVDVLGGLGMISVIWRIL